MQFFSLRFSHNTIHLVYNIHVQCSCVMPIQCIACVHVVYFYVDLSYFFVWVGYSRFCYRYSRLLDYTSVWVAGLPFYTSVHACIYMYLLSYMYSILHVQCIIHCISQVYCYL